MSLKFIKELPELVENNIISNEVSEKIQHYYSEKKNTSSNKLFVVFGVLGATLIGMGILLILAHNWDNFPRLVKTIIAFVPLLIGQIVTGFTILKEKNLVWRETSGTFLFFGIGISIALVSQIYNIPGDLGSYLLIWSILSLPVIYLLRAKVLLLFHLVIITYYACEVGYFGNDEAPWAYILLLLAVIPYYIMLIRKDGSRNIVSVFHWLFPISITITLGTFIKEDWELLALIYPLLYGLLYNIGSIAIFKKGRLRSNGYLVLGSFGTIYLFLIMSFKDVWKELARFTLFNDQGIYVAVVLFVLAVAVMVYTAIKNKKVPVNGLTYAFVVFTILYFIGLENPNLATIGINLLVFVLGIDAIKKGADQQHFGILNYGLLILTALIICRFFDTDLSFVVRGLLFMAIGIGFFLTNYIMIKQRNKNKVLDNNKVK